MPTFVMMTRLSAAKAGVPAQVLSLEKRAMGFIRACCPGVTWRASFALLGPYDYCDIFEAPDLETAFQVSALVRTVGHARTQVWPATPWRRFEAYMRQLAIADDAVEDNADEAEGASMDEPVEASTIGRLLGSLDDTVVAAILAVEPSFSDIESALMCLADPESLRGQAISDKARLIADIVAAAEADADDEAPAPNA
jgi:uncharacterized protein with GYD domain